MPPVFVNTQSDLALQRGWPPVTATRDPPVSLALTQKGSWPLPQFINRRGEISLVGPSGLLDESSRVQIDLRPNAGHLVSIRMSW